MLIMRMQTLPIDIHKSRETKAMCDTQHEQGAGKLANTDVGGGRYKGEVRTR